MGGWQVGMRTADVDAFVHRYATPILQAAGYRRNRRKYMIDGPRGRRAMVYFRPEVDAHHARFEVSYGVFTPAHEEFLADRGLPPSPWPSTHSALVNTRLFAPESVQAGLRSPGPVFPWNWPLGDDDRHNFRVGDALVSGLQNEVLPWIDSWFDPEVMVRTLENEPPGISVFAGLSPRPRAVAMALLDIDGADERLQQTIALLPPDDMVRQWIERRLR